MNLWSCDFETTTNEEDCRVWAFGCVNINDTDEFIFGNSLNDFMQWCFFQEEDTTIYFHNLKFDGEFILYWLLKNDYTICWVKNFSKSKEFKTLISDTGQFYCIEICFFKHDKEVRKIKILDSLKILPFPVKVISKAFNLPILKGEIDYHAEREVGHKLTVKEKEYLHNDCWIVASALQQMFKENLTQMTQGSNALHDFKKIYGTKNFNRDFPIPDYDADIRQAYRGGFTFCSPRYKGIDIPKGIVLDVNSLYPSVMYYDLLPYGEGMFFEGQYKSDKMYPLYIQTLTCNFHLKENHIPTIQLKNNLSFIPTEYLESSGDEDVTLYLTNIDLELFLEHYDVWNIEWYNGWKFKGAVGMFKAYIDKWNGIKVQASIEKNEGKRTLAKLMLNALYGKFALNPNVCSKYPVLIDDVVHYKLGEKEVRKPIYVPMGVFITSYARNKTIRSAQAVYDRFVYADTDSLHLIGEEIPKDLEISPTELGKWKFESTFLKARFLRAKTYFEVEILENQDIDKMPTNVYVENWLFVKNKITCSGMSEGCYKYVTWDNFKNGSIYGGKLKPKHTKGGVVLVGTEFTIK